LRFSVANLRRSERSARLAGLLAVASHSMPFLFYRRILRFGVLAARW
jgi:hypothetical protein